MRVLLALAVILAAAGCAARPAPARESAAAPCIPAAPAGSASPGRGDPVPDLTLPCLGAGAPVRLAGLTGPTVVNLWASWCAPCRSELPAIQRYADAAAGRVRVVGVATNDRTGAARSLAADLHLTFVMLYDENAKLLAAAGKVALPVTLFLSGGRVRYVYNAQPLDEAALSTLVRTYLGG